MLNSRERVLNNLLSWNVLASGKIVRKTTMLELEKLELNGKCKELDEEYDFVNKNIDEIKQKFVEDIKQNPQDWHIEEKDNSVIVKHKSGKEYYKEGFLKNEGFQESSLGRKRWSEIKNALSSADVGEKNQSYRNFIIVVVVSLLLMLAFIIYKRKRT